MGPQYTNLVIGDGQVQTVASQVSMGAANLARRLNVIFSNVGTQTETLVVTTIRSAGVSASGTPNPTGPVRRLARVVLDPNESFHVKGLPLNDLDVLLAVTTDAASVDYVVSIASHETLLDFQVHDDSGLKKHSPQIFEQLVAALS